MTIADLARRFAIPGHVAVVEGPGGLPRIEVTAKGGRATISPHAGQVLSFTPDGGSDLMFLSGLAYYADGKAIKGGVPICWPWFGPDPEGKGRPGHGFVRNRAWDVLATEAGADGTVTVRLGLVDTEETRAIWPHAFTLTLEVTVGAALDLALVTANTGTQAFTLSQGLHTYFAVGDIARTRVDGLDGCAYLDKMDGGAEKRQAGPVTITAETDRVYTGVSGPLSIVDGALGRTIRIESTGSASAVVWNPWAATAKSMADLGDDDYLRMICVETTNAGPDTVAVAPGGQARLTARYSLG